MPSKKKTTGGRQRSAPSATVKKRATKKGASTNTRSTASRTTRGGARRNSAGAVALVLDVLAQYGILRSLLAISGVLLIVFATAPGVIPVYSGWPFVRTVLVPVLAPLIFMLLLLDALMGRVLMSDMHGAERARRRQTVIVNLLLVVVLVLRWLPYYMALGK